MADGGASFNRGKSRQDYCTPPEFIRAVKDRFGSLSVDLAATASTRVVTPWLDEEDDALRFDWHKLSTGLLWLNPPFSNIAPWASKCAAEAKQGAKILLLVPASVGSEWFAEHVHPHAGVFALRPRLSFDGLNPFPKDCLLATYNIGVRGFDLWRWK